MLNSRPAQTMLEMVLAIGVILVSTLATTTLIVSTITTGRISNVRVAAANLAREGVEVVRGIRDSNWLRIDQNIVDPAPPTAGGTLTHWDDDGLTSDGYNSGTALPLGGLGANTTVYYYATFNQGTGVWSLSKCGDGTQAGCTSSSSYNVCTNNSQTFFTQTSSGCTGTTPVTTSFRRTISITRHFSGSADPFCFVACNGSVDAGDYLYVVSTVTSPSDQGFNGVTVEERLYNWK